MRAEVLDGPESDDMPNSGRQPSMQYHVYQLRILETFKGRDHVQKNLITVRGFSFVNLYTPLPRVSSSVHLNRNTEYLLSGKVKAGYLYTSFCDWHQRWAVATSEQQEGVRTNYSKGCQCLIGLSLCFTKDCPRLLKGCDGFPDPNFDCRAKFDRCEVNLGGNSCSWLSSKRRGGFQQCVKIPQSSFP